MKLSCVYADCCLPDYWSGHSLAHVSTAVTNQTTMAELKQALRFEVQEGAIGGSVSGEILESAEWHEAALSAIEEMETKTPDYKGPMFPTLPDQEEDADYSVYAYFVFTVDEE